MNTLERIENSCELDKLMARHVKGSSASNVYLLAEFSQERDQLPPLYYREDRRGLALFADEGTHYRLMFSVSDPASYRFPPMDKEICCDYVICSPARPWKGDACGELLSRNGFQKLETALQMRYCCGAAHAGAVAAMDRHRSRLAGLGMTVGAAEAADRKAAEKMIAVALGPYDAVRMPEDQWAAQLREGNILCVHAGRELAAVYVFTDSSGRIVVAPSYRGLGLSELLRCCLMAQPRWAGSRQNQYDWVNPENLPSLRGLRRIGAIETGKKKIRQIQKIQGDLT